eukprot:3194543-Prymnesium_polylepis.1
MPTSILRTLRTALVLGRHTSQDPRCTLVTAWALYDRLASRRWALVRSPHAGFPSLVGSRVSSSVR